MKRRDVLKAVGVSTVVGTAGLSAVASADDSTVDARTMRQHLSDHTDLLDELSAAGVLDNPGLGQFELDTQSKPGARTAGVSKTTATNFGGDRTTPSYVVNHETDDGFVHIRVRPELDFASATHRTNDGETTVYGAEVPGTDEQVSIECHGGCDYDCTIERCDDCAGEDCSDCCWCEPTCEPGCFC